MTRWLGIGLVTVAASAGFAAAPREGEVVVFRTAGQPERRLKVTHVSAFPDGETLVDVQDTATGDKYTLPGKVLAAAGRTPAPPTPPAPEIPAAAPPPIPAPVPVVRVPVPVPVPAPVVAPPPVEVRAPVVPEPPVQRVVAVAVQPDAQMLADIRPLLVSLHRSVRPTVREDAATGLTEGRYGSRPEVKATLAYAAMTDPAASVRAHCVRCLTALGYHHPVYVDYLKACASSGAPDVKAAAVAALAALAPRN